MFMNRVLAIVLLTFSAIALAQAPQLKSGSTIYIGPMDGYETYLAAAIVKKHVPLVVVADKDKADYIVRSTVNHTTPNQPAVVVSNSNVNNNNVNNSNVTTRSSSGGGYATPQYRTTKTTPTGPGTAPEMASERVCLPFGGSGEQGCSFRPHRRPARLTYPHRWLNCALFWSDCESRFAASKVPTASGRMPQRTVHILLQSAVTRCTEAPQYPDAPVDGQEADAAAGCIAIF